MGYTTEFSLEMVNATFFDDHLMKVPDDRFKGILEKLKAENLDADIALDMDGECKAACKWYNHEKDIAELSKKYEDALFILSGDGELKREGHVDLWRKYFKGGKMQKIKGVVIFPPYDKHNFK